MTESGHNHNAALGELGEFLASSPEGIKALLKMCPDILHVDRPFTSSLYYPNNGYMPAQFLPGAIINPVPRVLSHEEIMYQMKRLSFLLAELKGILILQKKRNGVVRKPDMYFESERLYITSYLRRTVLIEALSKGAYSSGAPKDPSGPVFDVVINTFEWGPKDTTDCHPVICVLHYKTTVYCCPIRNHRKGDMPQYLGPYVFNGAPSDFEIKIKFFMVNEGWFHSTKPSILGMKGEAVVTVQALQNGFTQLSKSPNDGLPECLFLCGQLIVRIEN